MKTVIAGIFLLLPFQTTAAQEIEPWDVAGCYRVQFREWPDESNHLLGPNDFARHIQLTTEEENTPFDWTMYKLRVHLRAENEYDRTPTSWMIKDQKVRIESVLAFEGLHLRLKVSEDSLYGLGQAFTDFEMEGYPSQKEGPVTLYPIQCPSGW